jgi:hypothetical protein
MGVHPCGTWDRACAILQADSLRILQQHRHANVSAVVLSAAKNEFLFQLGRCPAAVI